MSLANPGNKKRQCVHSNRAEGRMIENNDNLCSIRVNIHSAVLSQVKVAFIQIEEMFKERML